MSKRSGIMLAIPFEEHRLAKWGRPIIVQPKLDGMRCTIRWNDFEREWILRSSEGHYIKTVPHISDQINSFCDEQVFDKRYGFDGELYIPDMPFEDVVSRVKRKELHFDYRSVQFHCFDIIDNGLNQFDRTTMLSSLFGYTEGSYKALSAVPSWHVNCLAEVEALLNQFLQMGYEGFILRNPTGRYVEKRTSDMMKYKPTKQDEYTIIGVNEEVSIDGYNKGTLGSLLLSGPEGSTFSCGSGPVLTKSGRAELWSHREALIGRTVVVKYQNLTADKQIPRFPILLEVK